MSGVEVRLGAQPRALAGRFSGINHAFTQASEAALRKYALFDEGNAADLLAKIFRGTNFGYDGPRAERGRNTTLQDFTWGGRSHGFPTSTQMMR